MSDQSDKNKKKFKPFIYHAENLKGKKVAGEIYAPNAQGARLILRKQSLRKISVKPQTKKKKSGKKIKPIDIAIFFRQLSTMGAAGLPLIDALKVVIDGTEKHTMVALLKGVKKDIESGTSFSKAISKHPKYFDVLVCSLVASGEESGTLDTMLDRIALYKEKTEALKAKIKKAMVYPASVLTVALIVTIVLLVKVVPTFKKLFESFGAELPWFTQKVLDVSDAITNNWYIFAIVIGGGGYGLYYAFNNSKAFRDFLDQRIIKAPVFGEIIVTSIIARFARTLSTTFAAGVPLTDALTSVAQGSGNCVYEKSILQIRDEVSTGQQLQAAIKNSNLFPSMVIQMAAIGEESGELEAMLAKVADIYEERVDLAVDNLTTLMEPIIMVLLGLIIGSLVVAMYLPIFKLGSAI